MMHRNARQRMIITISAALAIVTILVISIMLGSDKNATIPVSSSTKIVIDSKDTSVFITTEERVDAYIEQHTSREFEVNESGDAINITTRGKGILQICLPSWQRTKSITVSTTSGDIVMDTAMTQDIELSSMTGSMMITGTSSTTLRAESNSGNIILTDTYTEDTIINNGTGYIRAIGALGNIMAEAKSGSIYVVPTGKNLISAKTDSGAINIISGDRSVSWSTEMGDAMIYGDALPPSGGPEDAEITAISTRGDITILE